MTEPRTRMSRLNLAVCAAAVVSAFLVLYVLSTGPFCWLRKYEYISGSLGNNITTLYAPIVWCTTHSKTFETILEAWVGWWVGDPVINQP